MKTVHDQNGELSLGDILESIWRKRLLVLGITLAGTLVGGVSALIVPKKYTASTVVSPVSSSSAGQTGALGSVASQLGGLAALAGLSASGDSKKVETIAVLQSETLTESFIRDRDLLPLLFDDKWDTAARSWKKMDARDIPTIWKGAQYFKRKVRSVNVDSKTGLVTVTISWVDPTIAAKWANELVRMTNDYLRKQAIEASERNIAYLNQQSSKTDALGVKQVIYSLLQNEIDKEMLARGNEEYALRIVDGAVAPDLASSPIFSLWVLIGTVVGLFVSLLVVYIAETGAKR